MAKQTWVDVVALVLILVLFSALSGYLRSHIFIYVFFGIVAPIIIGSLTVYLVSPGKIPRRRWNYYTVFVCGMLLTSFSAFLLDGMWYIGITLFMVGFILTIFGMWRTWQ